MLDLIDPVQSGKLFDEAIACTQRSGDQLFACILHNNAGVHALRVGDIPAARAHLEAAAQASRANGENSDTVAINLGWVRRQDGDHDGARSSFEDALRISRRSGERFDIAYAVLGLACLAEDAGEWSRACVLHGIAQAALDRTGEPWQEPEARYRRESLAQVRAHLGAASSIGTTPGAPRCVPTRFSTWPPGTADCPQAVRSPYSAFRAMPRIRGATGQAKASGGNRKPRHVSMVKTSSMAARV